MKKLYILASALFVGVITSFGQTCTGTATVVGSESFDDVSSLNLVTGSGFFNDGSSDHFNVTDGSNISGSASGFTGNYFAAEDVDDNGGTGAYPQEFTINFNITGYTNLNFSGLFAQPEIGGFDDADDVKVTASIDGGTPQVLIDVNEVDDGDAFNQRTQINGTELTTAAQKFTSAITGSGSTLTLKVTVSLNSGSETIAFDEFTICGDSSPPTLSIYDDVKNACQTATAVAVSGTGFTNILVNGKVIAAINPKGNDLGTVQGSIYIASTIRTEDSPVPHATSTPIKDAPFMPRTITLTPQNNSGATVRYYYTDAEFNAYKAYTISTDRTQDNIAIKDDLKILKVSRDTCSAGVEGGTQTGVQIEPSGTGTDVIGNYLEFDVTSFSSFSSTVNLSALALPIELTSFTAEATNSAVELTWETATETNNNYFEVLRSANGIDFEVIGKEQGSGTTTVSNSYSYVDESPLNGVNYYQLKQVDFDGRSTASNIVTVEFAENGTEIVVANNHSIMVRSAKTGTSVANIYNAQGQVVETVNFVAQQGVQTIALSNTLPTGIYFVEFVQEGQTTTAKFAVR